MKRKNNERRAARQCRDAISFLSVHERKSTSTLEDGRKRDRLRLTLADWRLCYPRGIPGEGIYSDGIPPAPEYAPQ